MARFKIVSDFDGVWTDQTGEAVVIRERLVRELARVTGEPVAAMRERVDELLVRIHAEPHSHGWAPQGRITAFVDEDPLCNVNAFCLHLERGTGPELAPLREAVLRAGFTTVHEFSDYCFVEGMAEFRRTNRPGIIGHAGDVLRALEDADVDIVIVSNSESEKLVDYFKSAGVDAGETRNHTLRVRGAAAKWALGSQPEILNVHDRKVFVDRPRYRETLAQERPDLVIGDVFSLDLSLPHVMRERGEPGAPRLLALKRHPHTPDWAAEQRAGGAIDHVVDDLMELVDIARKHGA